MLLYLVILIVCLVYYFVRQKFSYWSDRNVAHLPPKFPLGNLTGMGTKYHLIDIMRSTYEKFKNSEKIAGMYFSFGPVLVPIDLNIVETILVKNFSSFPNRGVYLNEKDEPLSAHLFAIEDEKWRFLRTKLSPTFTSGKIKFMYNTIASLGDDFLQIFLDGIDSNEPVDVKNVCQRFTSDVITSCAFGLDPQSLRTGTSEVLENGNKILIQPGWKSAKFFLLMMFRKWGQRLHIKSFPTEVSDFFYNLTKHTVEQREKDNIVRNDFLNLLIQIRNENSDDGNQLTIEQIAAQSLLFLIAGFETTSSTLTFALFNLARHTDVQDKVREEIQRTLAEHDGEISYAALKDMKYIDQVINETLRLFSPLGTVTRVAKTDFLLADTKMFIPKGQIIVIPVHAIHRDANIYPDPEKFDPDRFDSEIVQLRHKCSFIPFGNGPRNCIARRFGLLEVKFGIVKLLSQLKLTVNENTQLPLQFDNRSQILQSKNLILLNVEKF
uniref:Putative cytochrome n=1 Tax=Corethrella appendiculata TaxID=1370023 RepID=U5EKC8_9DIPT